MARAKKEKLSLEELVEQAVVKEEEQPYEVPSNWVWVQCRALLDVSYGRNLPTKKLLDEGYDVYGANGHIGYYSEYMFEKEQVLMSCRGAYSGKINKSSSLAYITNNSLILAPKSEKIDIDFLYRLFESLDKTTLISGSAQPQVTVQAFDKYVIPIPPLVEQQRIVERVESLFEKLDTAKELAQNALDSFENRKAAILHKAFTGELTAKWREENGVSLASWEEKEFKDVASVKSNLVSPSEYLDYPHIAPDNIEKRTGRLLEYRTIREDKVTSGKHRFYSGQILYSKIRPYLSKVVIVEFDGLCSADMYPIETELDTKFLWYYMLSDDFLMQASSAGSRSVLPKINQKELSKIKIIQPSINEQREIVTILDNILNHEQQAQELCDVVEKIDLMKKAILARAFRGELGTNNPEEESAIELLKEVLKEKL